MMNPSFLFLRPSQERRHISYYEGRGGPYQDVPSPSNGSSKADPAHQGESCEHGHDTVNLPHSLGESAEQEHAEQRSKGNGRDRQACFEHRTMPMSRQQSDREQD